MSNARIFVSNLNYACTEPELYKLFEEYGPVEHVKIITDRETNRSRGFGFVQMSSKEDAAAAIKELDGSHLGGRTIHVAAANPRPEKRNGNRDGDHRGGRRQRDSYDD